VLLLMLLSMVLDGDVREMSISPLLLLHRVCMGIGLLVVVILIFFSVLSLLPGSGAGDDAFKVVSLSSSSSVTSTGLYTNRFGIAFGTTMVVLCLRCLGVRGTGVMQAKLLLLLLLLLLPSPIVLLVAFEEESTMLRVGVVTEASRCCCSWVAVSRSLLPSLFALPSSMGERLRRLAFISSLSSSSSSSSSFMAMRKNLRFLKGSENFLEENGENEDEDSEERECDRRFRVLLLPPSQARSTMSDEGRLPL